MKKTNNIVFEFIEEGQQEQGEKGDTTVKVLGLIDLFAGTGAFSYAFHKHLHNCKTKYANDMIESSKSIYDLNNEETKLSLCNLLDVPVETIPLHDILTGGFPCQPFSIAGMQKGFDDDRSNVFWKILDIMSKCKPSIVILENVKNLQSHDNGNTFQVIKENIEKLGYHIKFKILNTSVITEVPQNRERIYIVCFKDKSLYDKFDFDFAEVINKPIKEFLEKTVPEKYYYKNTLKVYDEIKSQVTKHINENVVYQYRRYYVRENKNNVCPTLTANMGGGGHNVPLILDDNGIRKLTPRECFNLQGFPKEYKLPTLSDSKLYSLAGNAVSVPVVELIAKKINDIMES
jgi:DNA (cytosine-5)-methyltransferase 1